MSLPVEIKQLIRVFGQEGRCNNIFRDFLSELQKLKIGCLIVPYDGPTQQDQILFAIFKRKTFAHKCEIAKPFYSFGYHWKYQNCQKKYWLDCFGLVNPQKPCWKFQIPARGSPHACYKGPKTICIRLFSTQSDPFGGRVRYVAHRKHA